MAKSLDARLARLERAYQQRLYARIARELGLTVEALLQEAEQFLSQPLADQLAEVDRLATACEAQGEPWTEYEGIKATLIREYKP
jgi:hypothetical protein